MCAIIAEDVVNPYRKAIAREKRAGVLLLLDELLESINNKDACLLAETDESPRDKVMFLSYIEGIANHIMRANVVTNAAIAIDAEDDTLTTPPMQLDKYCHPLPPFRYCTFSEGRFQPMNDERKCFEERCRDANKEASGFGNNYINVIL